MEQVQYEGNRNVRRKKEYYNLDMIISIGFRVNSKKAIRFRTWANKILKEYMIKGFALDDNKFINGTKITEKYFEELLERIKLIRTSERVFYQKITDIFAECSIDYNKNSDTAIEFYKTVQNKFHYAITGQTAAEIIYSRADSEKENMGLTNWEKSPDGKILKSDIIIAKNYLDEKELNELNDLVTIYLDVAENRAKRKIIMKMEDWMKLTCDIFKINYYDVLEGNGSISHDKAIKKANTEYDKYSVIQDKNYVSDFDELVLETKYIIEKEKDRR